MKRELERIRPPFDPQLDDAEELLATFADSWAAEPSPAERRQIIASLFDRV